MDLQVQYFVCFVSHNTIEKTLYHDNVKISSRDISQFKIPDSVFAFQFFDVLVVTVEHVGQKVELKSKHVNYSPLHFLNARLCTKEEALRSGHIWPGGSETQRVLKDSSPDVKMVLGRDGYYHWFGDTNVIVLLPPSLMGAFIL
ncbi:MAG: hypothetical protein AAB394_04135 [Patescibacteria group bacterium]